MGLGENQFWAVISALFYATYSF